MSLTKVSLSQEFVFRTDRHDGDSSLVKVDLGKFINFPLTTKIHAHGYKVERHIADVSDLAREWYEGSTLVGIKDGMATMIDESININSVTRDLSWVANLNYNIEFHSVNDNLNIRYKHYYSEGPVEFNNIYLCTEVESVDIYDGGEYIIDSESSYILEFPPVNALVIKADQITYQ